MYKAFDLSTSREIILLDPRWVRRLNELKVLDRHDQLVCPGCRQPVRVRAGGIKRWHFAHKHLENCPLAHHSPALLAARAVIYEWLALHLDPDAMQVETMLGGMAFPRPLDLWVQQGESGFGFWIIENRLSPPVRIALVEIFSRTPGRILPILLAGMEKSYPAEPDAIILTTTERQFMVETAYDEGLTGLMGPAGKTLHYLDAGEEKLITYRGLKLVHSPQIHQGLRCSTPLAQVQVDLQSGEPVHPGDVERQAWFSQRKAEREALFAKARHASRQRRVGNPGKERTASQPRSLPPPVTGIEQNEEGICLICGQLTRDWWWYDRQTRRCKCRECLRRGQT